MDKRVWKFVLQPELHQRLELPKGTKPLSVHNQRGSICMWAEVDAMEKELQFFDIFIFETDDDLLPARGDFLGTCILEDGNLVLHVYVFGPDQWYENSK